MTEADIRKVVLESRPATVEDLTNQLRELLNVEYHCILQYKDPDFGGELCNLTNIDELPDMPTVKLIAVIQLEPVPATVPTQSSNDSDTSSIADTVILSVSPQDRQQPWPDFFHIPTFSLDVEYRLRQADLLYLAEATYLKVTKELKHEILEGLAESIYSFTPYPNKEQFQSVASALISKHPCLQEPASPSRCCGWKHSLQYKMANYRTKRRKSGCLDVSINAGKRGAHSTGGEPANKKIMKAKKGELNYLPNLPEGFDQEALERARKDVVEEMQKRTPDGALVKQKMDVTFAYRRKEVVESAPAISQMVERWPALFTENQVCSAKLSFKLICELYI